MRALCKGPEPAQQVERLRTSKPGDIGSAQDHQQAQLKVFGSR
jgi:hypothetical protein